MPKEAFPAQAGLMCLYRMDALALLIGQTMSEDRPAIGTALAVDFDRTSPWTVCSVPAVSLEAFRERR